MEPVVARGRGRPRKRKRVNEEGAALDCNAASNGVKTQSVRLLSRYVRKKFPGNGVYLGRVMLYNVGLYRVNYEDGDSEDLDSREVKAILIEDKDLTGKWIKRKRKLDEMLLRKDVNEKVKTEVPENSNTGNGDAADEVVKVDCDRNGDVKPDCSSDSCEDIQEGDTDLDKEIHLVPPPELPPSSGHIGVPDDHVSHLLSVYSFLRSFSVPLFLYPFELDDFVGALNCSVANSLLDSVHVALLRVIRRHLEGLSSGGSELASKCLRCQDWSLLDTLTWPIYLAHYLVLMGCRNGEEWKTFYFHSLERDYYSLSAGKKLVVMQILCEGVLDSEELRIELDSREESEAGIDTEASIVASTTIKTRRTHHGYSKNPSTKDTEGGPAGGSTDEDGNGDECRLCGMDGLLVCCDGCPSSYHLRCLGLNKMLVSDGSWYCPECKINQTEPKILRGTALRGGDVLGVDPFEQVFVASCDHLLVLKASIDSESCLRYYSSQDIPGVLNAIYSKQDHVVAYSEICRGVMEYWAIPKDSIACKEMSQGGSQSADKEGIGECSTHLVKLLDKVQDMSVSGDALGTSFIMTTTKTEPASFSSLNGQYAGPSQVSQQSTSSVTESVSCISRSSNIKYSSPMTCTSLELKASVPHRKRGQSDYCTYMGSSFQPTGFINYFIHGDYAASAAANFAVLSPEESQGVSRSLVNHRKVLNASVALQVKAFSSSATRFFWPNTEKKIFEVPRERCGWCLNCKAPVLSRKGCLLNAAAANAIKGYMKVLAGFRPVRNRDWRLHGIATYILFMEESLSGLLCGPFLNGTSRKHWRNQVEQTTSYNAIKIRLLELEENIRTIAFSGDWTKIVEGGSAQSSISQTAASGAGSTQKRRPGRRGRKPAALVEVAVDDFQEIPNGVSWWRGGRLSKHMFQRGVVPFSIIRNSALKGGTKKIPGIHYAEGNGTPKSSKQLAWRSSVEMSRNMANLALQVRYLDFHVRWGDLVCPEQSNSDAKGPEAEAHAFRNAFICDKKIVGLEIRYSVAFGSQKHLPSRILKNITEVEQIPGGEKEKYWFSEAYIPLYLIKEYEQKLEQYMPVNVLPKLRTGRRKASDRNIFSDLFWKQNNAVKSCCSCRQDVFYRTVVQCTECQGFCHENCSTRKTVKMSNKEPEFVITCRQCVIRATTQVQTSRSPTSTLPLQKQVFRNPSTTTNHGKSGHAQGSSTSIFPMEEQKCTYEVKSTNRTSVSKKNRNTLSANKKVHLGLIWKKNNEDTGIDFRLNNILMRGNPNASLINPICRICTKPYNADLMYIRCDACQHWFHADAVELDESKIYLLVGFKCCKCRRLRSPICPYMDLDDKIALELRQRKLDAKHENDDRSIAPELVPPYPASIQTMEIIPDESSNQSNNVTLSGPGPRKLPVRRHVNQEKDTSTENLPVINGDAGNLVCNTGLEGTSPQLGWVDPTFNDYVITLEYDSLTGSGGDVEFASGGDVEFASGGDVEFEPQTYFSFNELLASDNENETEAVGDVIDNLEKENGVIMSYDQEGEPVISLETDANMKDVACRFCTESEPYPDLYCELCGLRIHRDCSRWCEESSRGDVWLCGDCREWR